MEKLICFVSCILLFSCSIKKTENLNTESNNKIIKESKDTKDYLTTIESNIVNDFLEGELVADYYKRYKGYQHVTVMESLPKKKAIESYLYSLRESREKKDFPLNKQDSKKFFLLDLLEIKKINSELENEPIYLWKLSDFKNIKMSLITHKKIIEMSNTGEYLNLPNRLIIYLSKPLIFDSEKAFISFSIGSSFLSFNPICHFSALMIKENNKWVKIATYDDGIYN